MNITEPLITVAICTHNRARSLERTLRRLAAVPHPAAGSWEVVVVDNASSDSTSSLLSSLAPTLPLRWVTEPTLGLSAARNRAIIESRGRWIAWTDDDVLVSDQWLAEYHRVLSGPDAPDVVGGPVRPLPDDEPVDFVAEALRVYPQVYAVVDLGREEGPLWPGHVPYGANMVIRRDLLLQRGFDPDLGSSGGVHLLGEDTVVLDELLAAGATGRWLPKAAVDHCLPTERLNPAYVERWAFAGGRTHVRESLRLASGAASIRRVRAWLWRRAWTLRLRHRFRPATNVRTRVIQTFEVAKARGILAELRATPRAAARASSVPAVA